MPVKHGKWVPLLGDDLARRVVRLAPEDPAAWCRDVVLKAVNRAEATKVVESSEQAKCPHLPKDRVHQRCKACGMRGLPEIAKGEKT